MKIITKYLLLKYLKYFFIILISLQFFFVGIDVLKNLPDLPKSANLQLLFVIYDSFFTFTITLPLSLIFGWIITITVLVKNNELVSFYSLSISKSVILKPIIFISILITLVLIFLQATPLAYSLENKNKILNNRYFVNEKSNIFLKYNNYFVYFKKLYPLEKKAKGIHIFQIKNHDIVEIVVAKKAYFQNNRWYVTDTKIIKKPEIIDWNKSKIVITNEKFLYTLEGFEPKIINNVYKRRTQFSIIDAVRTILLLENQDFNTNKIKAILYSQILVPYFVIPLIIMIFLFTNPSSRFFNTAAFTSITIFLTLIIWGILFLLQKLALGGIVSAEFAIIFPLGILSIITYYIYNKKVV